jgi:diacylglycerol kinase family enzyme
MVESPPGPPLVVVNPAASGLADAGRRGRIVASIVAAVEARTGRTPVVADSTAENARIALRAARSSPLVVVAGGDGTIRDAAEVLAGSDVPVAIVPAGTGNVFASALAIPRRTAAAVRLIESGRPQSVDLGRAAWGPDPAGGAADAATERAFVVACGVGFDARVMAGASQDLKRRFGFGAYVLSAARQAARLRPVDFRVECDGELHEVTGLLVLLANCGQILPGLVGPRRPIDPADGLLDVIVIRAAGVVGGLAGVAEVLWASDETSQGRRRRLRLRAAQVRVASTPTEPIQVDGDHGEAAWLSAVSLPGALRVVRP